MTLSRAPQLDDLLPAFASTDAPLSLVRRWREVVAALPDVTAVTDVGDSSRAATSYTYAELDRLTDLLALEIVRAVGESTTPIVALLGHDANAAVAALALIKTGRIRVLLDTHAPLERLRQIVALAGSSVALVDRRHDATASALGLERRLSLDALLDEALASNVTEADLAASVASELALGESRAGRDPFEIVFTSGSTGAPKGVVQLHGTFLNDAATYRELRETRAGDPVAVVLPLSFVAGSLALLAVLLGGATAWLIDPRDSGVGGLLQTLRDRRIVGLACTPHLARGIVSGLGEGEILPDLRSVVTLGEAVHGRDVEALLAHLGPDAFFLNEVGASEICALTTFRVGQGDPVPVGTVPAGHVVPGKTIRIVGEDGTEVAPGESGEVIVVSDKLSGGYWQNDEQNAIKFGVADDGRPFVRQGDLARRGDDGVVHLLGRGDAGVKVRGYLVEPSEIEGALLSMDDIDEAVVIPAVAPGAATRLIAYIVPRQGVRSPSTPDLRRSLRAVLPEYMVPSEILQLTALPRTERGKVDRRSLPEVPERVVDASELSPNEIAMAEVWCRVLELPAVGPDDDFMGLGGDSLSVEELSIRVKDRFGKEMVSSDVLAFPTLREFTRKIVTGGSESVAQDDHVVFNGSATGTPFFAFAGATALAITFLPLSKHLPDHPLYTFQQHALERRALPDRTIEAVAARHLETIRSVRPHGPYTLIGHSYGGLVAFEAAQQLRRAGEEVESLVILDSYLPPGAPGAGGVGSASEAASAPAPSNSLLRRFLPHGLPERKELARHLRARLAGVVRFGGEVHYDAMMDLVLLLMRRYDMQPYPGRTALFIAYDNPDGASGWDSLLTGERVDFGLEIEHDSLLREPYVATVADLLHSFLERGADVERGASV